MKIESLPGVTIGVAGKVCSAGLHIGLDGPSIGGGCSPENAGTVPVRVVAAKVLRESRI